MSLLLLFAGASGGVVVEFDHACERTLANANPRRTVQSLAPLRTVQSTTPTRTLTCLED